ncbi:hypothetical protein CMV_013486 [Castanea mollissima]|uniref:Uncharacterized protein n=1 Tax=Castanea mollissima TaxID=60419 RepID=A0A8J4VLV5_9ROSI|nr:hypothetical protein CMV_013486 [Castanea mollissima]
MSLKPAIIELLPIRLRRNKGHFNEPSLPLEKILKAAEALLAEFHEIPESILNKKKAQIQHWSPPAASTYKVNNDGAYFADEEKAGIGVVNWKNQQIREFKLLIRRCPKLSHLPDGLDCLTRLKYLGIGRLCEELDVSTILCSIQHQHLQTSLEELQLFGCDKLNTPPDEILRFTGLKHLILRGCPSARTFNKWLKRRMPHLEVSFWY